MVALSLFLGCWSYSAELLFPLSKYYYLLNHVIHLEYQLKYDLLIKSQLNRHKCIEKHRKKPTLNAHRIWSSLLSLSIILLHYVIFFVTGFFLQSLALTCLQLSQAAAASYFIHQKGSTQAATLQGFHIIPQLWQGLRAHISFHSTLTASWRLFQRVPSNIGC